MSGSPSWLILPGKAHVTNAGTYIPHLDQRPACFKTATFVAFCVEESSKEANRPPVLVYHVQSSRHDKVMRTSYLDSGSKSHACLVDVQPRGAVCLVPSSPCHAEAQGRLIRTLAYALEREVLSNESTDSF